jgi:hypothetical protein
MYIYTCISQLGHFRQWLSPGRDLEHFYVSSFPALEIHTLETEADGYNDA